MKFFKAKNLLFVFLFLGFSVFLFPAYGEIVSIKDILTKSDAFEAREVEVTGEVIGEILKGDGGFWLNISSQGYNLGIYSKSTQDFAGITHWGKYQEIGDQVKIKGRFYKNCPLHQMSDIHLERLTVVKRGYKKYFLASASKSKLAIILFTISLTTAAFYFIKERYARRT